MRPIGTIWFFLDRPSKRGSSFLSFLPISLRLWAEKMLMILFLQSICGCGSSILLWKRRYFCHLSLALLLTVIISRNVTVIRYRSVIKVCLFRENTRVTGRPATIFLERTLLPPRRKIAKIVAISWHRIVPRGFLPRISRIAKRLRDS